MATEIPKQFDPREAQKRWGFTVHVQPPVLVDGERASSSRIRELLRAGGVEAAARFLGRPYALQGTVVRGDQRSSPVALHRMIGGVAFAGRSW